MEFNNHLCNQSVCIVLLSPPTHTFLAHQAWKLFRSENEPQCMHSTWGPDSAAILHNNFALQSMLSFYSL